MSLSLVSYGDSDSDIEPEDNSAKPGSDIRKLLSVLPSSRRSLKQKGPVKIGLPTLNKGVSSSHASCLIKHSSVRRAYNVAYIYDTKILITLYRKISI